MYKSVKGIILREVRYKETDKILTALTDTEGRITVTAHGAFSKKSTVTTASQLLTYSDMELDYRNGRYTLKEAQVQESFANLKKDIVYFSLGCYFAQCVECFSLEDEPDDRLLRLLLNSLYALDKCLYPQKQIKAAFELKMASLIGYEPLLSTCAKCGKSDPEVILFNISEGRLYCGDCSNYENDDFYCLKNDTVEAMRFIIASGLKKFISFSISDYALDELSRVTENYLKYHSDRKIETLDYWKSLL